MTQALHEDIRKYLERQGTTDPSFDSIASLILEVFDAQVAVAYTLDSRTGMLKLRCHRGFSKQEAEKVRFLCLGKGLPGRAAATRLPVQGYHEGERGSAAGFESHGFPPGSLFVPMLRDSTLHGVLGIAKGFHHEFAPDAVASLSSIARLIATYLK